MYSKKYIEELRIIHADKTRLKGFGGKMKDLGEFHTYMDKWKPSSVLDYGCGKGTILGKLKEQYPDTGFAGYDPAVVYYANGATEVDCVFSNDVLEHIEPEFIGQVLHHIDTLANKYHQLLVCTSLDTNDIAQILDPPQYTSRTIVLTHLRAILLS